MPLTKIQSLGITDGTIVAGDIASGAITAAKLASGVGGKVLQVVQATKVGTQTISGSGDNSPETFTDITDLSVSVTPSSASNKILILANVLGSANNNSHLSAFRGSTNLSSPTSPSTRTPAFAGDFINAGNTSHSRTWSIIFLDSPSTTSSTTYKLGASIWGVNTLYINRAESDADAGYQPRATSTLIVMEIAG